MRLAKGCLLVVIGLVIAWFVIEWLASLSRNAPILGHVYGTIFCALIVTPLVVVFIKLAKPKAVQHSQDYSVNPYWTPQIEQIKPINSYVPPQTEQIKFNNPYATPQINSAPPTQVRPKTRIIDRRYIPTNLRRAVFDRDNGQCRRCGSRYYLDLDHIIPLSKGGATSYDNLQVLCRSCNGHKGNR